MHALFLRIFGLVAAAGAAVALITTPSSADSTPVGALPKGPVATIATHRGLLVALALPHPASGLVWRLARPVNPKVMHQISEAEVGKNVVVVYAVTGKGQTSIIFALTRGDSSPKAESTATLHVRAT